MPAGIPVIGYNMRDFSDGERVPMKRRVLRADPSGNITLFVLDPVRPAERAAVAARLMALCATDAEQVGFVCPPERGGDGRLEMAGGEFCGNAARAFGMLLARNAGLTGTAHVRAEVSGCAPIVGVDVDLERGTAYAEMPPPRLVRRVETRGVRVTLVHLGGIAHLVVEGVAPGEAFFAAAEPLFTAFPGLDAYGVMFLADGRLTPLVKVPAVGSLVWEGSCGSGTLAAAVAQSVDAGDGVFARDYVQPAGVLRASVARRGGEVAEAGVGGTVTLGEAFFADV